MKKKRSEIKTSESSSNAKSSGGGTSDKASNNSHASPPKDKHHNQSFPCSNMAAAIAQEIFPTVGALSLSRRVATGEDLGHAVENGERTGRLKSPPTPSVAAVSETGKKSKSEVRKIQDNPPSTQQQQPSPQEQPLLGYMIHRFLIAERMRKREAEAANTELSTATTTSTKKKKTKKKKTKKKSGSMPTENGDDNNDIIENQLNQREENECQLSSAGTVVEPAGALPESPPSAFDEKNSIDIADRLSDECGIDTGSQASTPCNLPSFDEFDPPPSSSLLKDFGTQNNKGSTFSAANSRSSGLDRLLDSLIDSGESSSIRDAVSTQHRNGGGRCIESFSVYLRQKYESHLEKRKQQRQTQQQKKEKSKGIGGGGSINAAADIPSSLDCTKKNSTMHGDIELRDILPTISFKDVNDLVEKSIDCRKCRTSANSHLRSLSAITKDNFHSSCEGVEIELRTKTPTITKHPAFVLNEHSASILCSTSSPVSVTKHDRGLSIPVSGIFSDDIDSAFSYLNMDEFDLEKGEGGCGIEKSLDDSTNVAAPQQSSFHLELHPISRENVTGYLQVRSLSGKEKGGEENATSVEEYPMNTNDIIDLVKFILLPCGLTKNALGEDEANDSSGEYALSGEELSEIANEAARLMTPIQSKIFVAKQSMLSINEIMEKAENSNSRSHIDSTTVSLLLEADAKIEIVFKQLGEVMLKLFKLICFVGWSLKRGPRLLRFAQCLWKRYNEALYSLIEPTLQHRGSLLQASARERHVPQACFDTVVRNSFHELVMAKTTVLSLLVHDFNAILNGEKSLFPKALAEICVLQAVRQYVELPKTLAVDDIFPDQESEALLQQLIAARIHLSQTTINCVLCDDIIKKAKEQRDTLDVLCRTVRKVIIAMEDFAPENMLGFLRRGYETHEFSYYDLVKSHNSLSESDAGFEARNAALLLKISLSLIMQWLILLCSRQYHESPMESLSLPSNLEKWLASTSETEFHNYMPNDKKEIEECDGSGGDRRISSILAGLLYRWLEARCSEWHAELTRDELLQSMDMEETALVNEESGKVGKKKKSKRKSGGKKERVEKNESGGGIGTCDQEQQRVVASSDETKGDGFDNNEILVQQRSIDVHHPPPLGITIGRVPLRETCNSESDYHPGVGVVDGQQFVAAEVYLVNRLKMILVKGADSG